MLLVLTTAPEDKVEELSSKIVEEKLAACSLIVDLENSKFWWEGKVNVEEEDLIVFKTLEKNLEKVTKRIKELHPYDVPFIGKFNIDVMNPEYQKWLEKVIE